MTVVDRHLLRAAAFFLITLCGTAPGAADGAERWNSCVIANCHSSFRDTQHLHFPVAMGVCKICHRPTSAGGHDFRLAREGGDLCRYCHPEIGAEHNDHSIFGARECTICHDPHGSGHRFLLPEAQSADMCEGCHAQILRGRSVLHTPVATGPCTVCHDPHGSDPDHTAGDTASLCFQCHEVTGQELETLDHIHEPLKSGDCGHCHDAHGSESAMNLRDDVPALCYRCHEEIERTVQTAMHQHSVASEPGGCLICHSPHASSVRFGLNSDPLTLCRGCHENDMTTEEGETIPGFAHQVEGKKYLHGPVRQRDCGACHNSHGSDHFRLLVGEYSPEFYASFDLDNFQLCFSCHPQRGVLTEETTTLTDFRNGKLNLHYLHVNKPDKGRTCRACHATHASDRPKHISDRIWFGDWEMPITFAKTETGGNCESGCHRPRAYDREMPVDYGEEGEPVPDRETPPGEIGE
ncbi:MAG: hypothetical protein JSV91_00865 [Phycisphaerales bacterium]|nr:MAG: hypothetical protein JSV91_00865 [Phycisphaerales bacterium]